MQLFVILVKNNNIKGHFDNEIDMAGLEKVPGV